MMPGEQSQLDFASYKRVYKVFLPSNLEEYGLVGKKIEGNKIEDIQYVQQ